MKVSRVRGRLNASLLVQLYNLGRAKGYGPTAESTVTVICM